SRIGWIEQGGANWVRDESVVACLGDLGIGADAAAQLLLSHKFPLALAQRPLRSLSPGDRARAALICLFARSPAVEVLVLDEPTFSLDLVGLQALARALKLWPGGLVVTSHDREFLEQIGVHRTIRLGACDRQVGNVSGRCTRSKTSIASQRAEWARIAGTSSAAQTRGAPCSVSRQATASATSAWLSPAPSSHSPLAPARTCSNRKAVSVTCASQRSIQRCRGAPSSRNSPS